MRLIHITDPHLTSLADVDWRSLRGKRLLGFLSWYRRRRYVHRREVLDRLVAAVGAARPDRIVISGDLIHIGLPAEIAVARRWLEQLTGLAPVALVPGNHDAYAEDSPAALRSQWHSWLQTAGAGPPDHGLPTWETGGIAIIGLSTALPTAAWLATGAVGRQQIQALDRVLADCGARGVFRCIVLHHPPLPGMTSYRRRLCDAGELAQVLQRHGVELVVHGHLHMNSERALGERTVIYGTASASSASRHAPAAYRVFDIERSADGWSVAMQLHIDDGAGFKPANERRREVRSAPMPVTSAAG